VENKGFTAKNAKELAGLSYRQLNDWESRGAIPSERDKAGAWRKFTAKEIFALMVCGEIRQRYGIPVEKIRFVREFMMAEKADHLAAAVRLMEKGLSLYLLTDFAETFIIDSDLEFADLMRNGYFRADHPESFIFMRLNDIVNKLGSALKQPELKRHDRVYRVQNEIDAMISVRDQPEVDVLQAIRSRKFDQISVTIKDWGISEINAEGDLPPEQLVDEKGKVILSSKCDFETFTVSRADGRIIRARRKIPMKYSAEDNRQALFVGIYRGKESESGNK